MVGLYDDYQFHTLLGPLKGKCIRMYDPSFRLGQYPNIYTYGITAHTVADLSSRETEYTVAYPTSSETEYRCGIPKQ